MKMRSVKYLVGEGFKSTWANRLMSLASIGVLVACMVLIGLAILITENVNLALGRLEQENTIMVYMKDYSWALYGRTEETEVKEDADENGISESDYVIHNEEEAKALCQKIADLPNVETADYVSGEEGLDSVKKNMFEGQAQYFDFLNSEHGNPLSDAARVTMNDMSKFDETIESIKKIEGVDTIQSQGDLAEKIAGFKRGFALAAIWIIAILLVIALIIVSNTIRVTMYSRKLEISIMKAVGATNSFIRLPFVIEGIIIGIISAVVSEGILYFVYTLLSEKIATALSTNQLVPFGDMALIMLAISLLIGIFSGTLGSIIIISKYLRREGSEFSAI
ncbi:MAG: permease-like cell division protein FtsX [Clostridia bacterium]|nr:permease-like cell division protein FtsX [Clostridia bacterium]